MFFARGMVKKCQAAKGLPGGSLGAKDAKDKKGTQVVKSTNGIKGTKVLANGYEGHTGTYA